MYIPKTQFGYYDVEVVFYNAIAVDALPVDDPRPGQIEDHVVALEPPHQLV